jgi:putative ABC transport system permease protein
MNIIRQIVAVSIVNLRSLPQRIGSSSVVVIGIAGVVGVVVSVLTMAGSLSGTLLSTGSAGRAIVLRVGATSEIASSLSSEAVRTILNAPGVARTADGDPIGSGDQIVPVNLTRKEDGTPAPLTVRGVSPQAFTLRPEIELVEGRMFTPGLREVIIGRVAQVEIAGVALGDRVELRDSEWTVVGVFRSSNAFESGMLTDASTLSSAYQRSDVNGVTVLLDSPDRFEEFKNALTTNPALTVDVLREPEYFARQSEELADLLFFVTYVVGAIMAVGALFGALNTMYSAVSTRMLEIATLRALGYGPVSVVMSVLTEALLLAALGGVLGASIAWLLFSGNTISLGGQLGSLVTELRIGPAVLGAGLLWACAVGFLGGLFPAIRAARLPVATALRAL